MNVKNEGDCELEAIAAHITRWNEMQDVRRRLWEEGEEGVS